MQNQCKKRSGNDKWKTPDDLYKQLYKQLNDEFKFTFDPCPIDWKEGDISGLIIDWGTSNFVNPPYSQTKEWIKKAYMEWRHANRKSVLLVNACTDTKEFHEYCVNRPGVEIRFIKGRVKFINYLNPEKKGSNMKPSILIIFK